MRDLRVGFYGDDVTGSVDVLLQFRRCGIDGRLFVGQPDAEDLALAAASAPVVGIAGIARSLEGDALEAEVRPALDALRATGADIVQYKACSTADSSPTVGSLGRVLEIGRELFGDAPVPMLFAQPSFGRYTVFGHHFALENGVVHRLDRQPTMSAHPSTPMDESDLVRHLARQTSLPISSLPLTSYDQPIEDALSGESSAAVVLDALDDSHLALIGAALLEVARERHPLFALGSGGLSRALALATGSAPRAGSGALRDRGPVLVVSGSRSPQTRRQVAAAEAAGWLVRPLGLGADAIVPVLAGGRSVVLTSDETAFASDQDPLVAIAEDAASAVDAAIRAGVTHRIIVCGGDTSGRVARLIGVRSLSIAAEAGGNVVLLRAHSEDRAIDGLELLLKGGQVGGDDLFERIRSLPA